MKRLLSLFLAACLALSLSGCLADYDTPKHAELSEQYDFYADSQSALSSGMAITPEQADEVFIVLVSCGMEAKVTNVTRKAGDDGHCQVSAGLYVYDVYYTDGVVDRVEYNGEELYPNPAPAPVEPAPTDDPAALETRPRWNRQLTTRSPRPMPKKKMSVFTTRPASGKVRTAPLWTFIFPGKII